MNNSQNVSGSRWYSEFNYPANTGGSICKNAVSRVQIANASHKIYGQISNGTIIAFTYATGVREQR